MMSHTSYAASSQLNHLIGVRPALIDEMRTYWRAEKLKSLWSQNRISRSVNWPESVIKDELSHVTHFYTLIGEYSYCSVEWALGIMTMTEECVTCEQHDQAFRRIACSTLKGFLSIYCLNFRLHNDLYVFKMTFVSLKWLKTFGFIIWNSMSVKEYCMR